MSNDSALPERWLPVVGYEGSYEVSDHGRVRSIDRLITDRLGAVKHLRGRMLRLALRPDGYIAAGLSSVNHGGQGKSYAVHQLVLRAFVGKPPPGQECCHGNGDPADNRLLNLRWDTSTANNLDKRLHGTDRNAQKTACPRGHALAQPNLVRDHAGGRACLACDRASSNVAYASKIGLTVDCQDRADEHYRRIVEGLAPPRAERTICANGHRLEGCNLRPQGNGGRRCLACSRANATVSATMSPAAFQVEADKHYVEIMAGTARGDAKQRTHCPAGHRLVAPNLVPSALAAGARKCRSCARGAVAASVAKRSGQSVDRGRVADEHYRKIMSGG